MVGATCALALAQKEFKVTLIENSQFYLQNSNHDFDNRVSAINRISQNIFSNLNVWLAMKNERVTPYQTMRVWDKKGFGEITFEAEDLSEPDLGHIVENRVILSSVWKQIVEHKDIEVLSEKEILAIDTQSDKKTLQFSDSTSLDAKLIIAADGANSKIRDLAKLKVKTKDYKQEGLVTTIKTENGNQATAWQRFMTDGPLALLPIGKDIVSIVWSTTPERAAKLEEMPEREFEKLLTTFSQNCCGSLKVIGPRQRFKLKSQHAESYVSPGIVLIGDAAHVVHPLAGQGVNLGLLDVAVLLDILVEARDNEEEISSLRTLRRYERARKSHNLTVQTAMDFFSNTFGSKTKPYFFLRNFGLKVTNSSRPLKRIFMKIALGSNKDLPSLGRYFLP